jgi:tRNA G18 (ribose-2'-O)-methylase SpoU
MRNLVIHDPRMWRRPADGAVFGIPPCEWLVIGHSQPYIHGHPTTATQERRQGKVPMMIACLYLLLVRFPRPSTRLWRADAGCRCSSSVLLAAGPCRRRHRRVASSLLAGATDQSNKSATRLFLSSPNERSRSSSNHSVGKRNSNSNSNTGQKSYYSTSSATDHFNDGSPSSVLISTKGATIQRIKKLLNDASFRQAEKAAVVENPKLVRDLYENETTRHLIRQILVDADRYQKELQLLRQEQEENGTQSVSVSNEWRFLFDLVPPHHDNDQATKDDATNNKNSIQLIRASYSVLRSCTDTIAHQGMLAVCDRPVFPQRPARSYQSSFRLILDGVSDPGNLGTLLRGAAATDVDEVILLPGCCDPWNPKAVRAAGAATFFLPSLKSVASYDEWYERMRQKKVQLYAATMVDDDDHATAAATTTAANASSQSGPRTTSLAYSDIDWNDSTTTSGHKALILGNEGSGLSDYVTQRMRRSRQRPRRHDPPDDNDADDYDDESTTSTTIQPIHIPMTNGAVESLNVAVSGSVIMFERARQLAALAEKATAESD